MQCTNCKSEILATAKFCPECGNKVENQGKTCPNKDCNRTGLPVEALFCPDCGTKLTGGFENFTETVNGVSFDMIAIKGGTFQMGSNESDSEKPIHSVPVNDFFIGKMVVTQVLWKVVMCNNPSHFKGDNLPVEKVRWNDAQEFIKKINILIRKNYRLPSEAEWEYAAGGGATRRTRWAGTSNESSLRNYAWYNDNDNSNKGTHPVGTKSPNGLGLYDMSGNVWEWCEDDWYDNYNGSPIDGRSWDDHLRGSRRVNRGGSWNVNAQDCRTAIRNTYGPDYRNYNIGFRLVSPK